MFWHKEAITNVFPITFTKLTNVTNVENYLLMLVIWKDTSNCSWRLQNFQMWIFWKIIYSSWFSEQTHRNYLFRSQRFQMWLLWKIFPHVGNMKRHIMNMLVNDFSQDLHLKSLWPSWTVLMCLLILPA